MLGARWLLNKNEEMLPLWSISYGRESLVASWGNAPRGKDRKKQQRDVAQAAVWFDPYGFGGIAEGVNSTGMENGYQETEQLRLPVAETLTVARLPLPAVTLRHRRPLTVPLHEVVKFAPALQVVVFGFPTPLTTAVAHSFAFPINSPSFAPASAALRA